MQRKINVFRKENDYEKNNKGTGKEFLEES